MRIGWIMERRYLKKTKLLYLVVFLVSDIDFSNVKVKLCDYIFNRGTEFLQFYCGNYFFDIIFYDNRLSIDIYDDDRRVKTLVFFIDKSAYLNTNIIKILDKY